MLTAELSSVPAPVSSRRIGAGVRPAPGTTAGLPSRWGATDWVEAEVRGAVDEHRQLCRAQHVDPDTVVAVARTMAHFADYRTGRECRPTNDRLSAVGQMSISTVQRARRVLKALGLVVELVAGRSVMTRAERLTAWRRGSSHRRVAAEFALCSRRRRPQRPRCPQDRRAHVDRDTPPSAFTNRPSSHDRTTHLQTTTDPRRGAPRPAATSTGPPPRRPQAAPGTRRLAEQVQRRLPWL